jgi:hypothetical protein
MRISAYSGDEELQLRPFGETDPTLLTAYLQGLERSLVKKRTEVVMSGDKIYEYPDFRHKDA